MIRIMFFVSLVLLSVIVVFFVMARVHIQVCKPEVLHPERSKEIYRNILEYDDSVSIPFNKLYDGLRLLYPQDYIVIHFSII